MILLLYEIWLSKFCRIISFVPVTHNVVNYILLFLPNSFVSFIICNCENIILWTCFIQKRIHSSTMFDLFFQKLIHSSKKRFILPKTYSLFQNQIHSSKSRSILPKYVLFLSKSDPFFQNLICSVSSKNRSVDLFFHIWSISFKNKLHWSKVLSVVSKPEIQCLLMIYKYDKH